MIHNILLVEDEATLAKNICIYLLRYGYDVHVATNAETALRDLDTFKPDLVILDFNLPGMNGVQALARIRDIDRQIKVIMITAYGSIDLAVEAMQAGAYHFITKPIPLSKLKLMVDKAFGDEQRDQALSYYQQKAGDNTSIESLLGDAPAMHAVRRRIRQMIAAEESLRDTNVPAVLICGETGTGKELVARALHFNGPRRAKPFVEINCASIHHQLLESELFGHERGAFTDAREKKFGLFETAEGGTLFLDEIGDMDMALQARVLKVIEEKIVRRLGSVRDQRVDVRILAATHRTLDRLVREGKFRSDLYFRLRMLQIEVPPLRERGDDALLLARHFLALHAARYARAGMSFDQSAEAMLRQHCWPGNVRELRNVIEQAVLLAPGAVIDCAHLNLFSPLTLPNSDEPAPAALTGTVEFPREGVQLVAVERDLVLRALNHTEWNVTKAARLLGLSRDTLRYRIDKFGLSASAKAPANAGAAAERREEQVVWGS